MQWGITSVKCFSTVEGIQYIGGTFSTVGDNFNTVGIPLVLWRLFSTMGITSVQWGITSVLWRLFSIVGKFFISTCLTVRNDEKMSIFFCITKRNFHSQVSTILTDFMPFKRWTGVLQVQTCF